MADSRGTGSDQTRKNARKKINIPKKETGSTTRGGFPGMQASIRPDIPVPIKSIRASSLHDTGVALAITQQTTPQDCKEGLTAVMDLDDLIGHKKRVFTKLDQSLMVRLAVPRGDDEIRVLCDSREIQRRGIKLILTCRLDIVPGMKLGMDLFIPTSEQPIPVTGKVRRVLRSSGEDVVRYLVEVEFDALERTAADSISRFIQEAKLRESQHLPA